MNMTKVPLFSGKFLIAANQGRISFVLRGVITVCLAVLPFGIAPGVAKAQQKEWIWLSGSEAQPPSGGLPGVYGTLGMPAPANIPGGRWVANSWTDRDGNPWLFGGQGYGSVPAHWGDLNDLWKFDQSTREWIWMGGSDKISESCPGASLGIYGTKGVPSTTNIPGGRYGAINWTDSQGHFWIYGGMGPDSQCSYGALNDLWEFDPLAGTWEWVAGESIFPAKTGDLGWAAVYGVLGISAPANSPGGRYSSSSWVDTKGDFWLFGGFGFDSADNKGILNDLWKFDPSTLEWTWMAGKNTVPGKDGYGGWAGIYGTLGLADVGNNPGSRVSATTWTDSSGNIWLFGGSGYPGSNKYCNTKGICISNAGSSLNDFWKFDTVLREWAWMNGSSSEPANAQGQPGIYGTQGVAASSNAPGGRYSATSWTDKLGNFWLFGGEGFDAGGKASGSLNDLWKFDPKARVWTWIAGSSNLSYQPQNQGYGKRGIYDLEGISDPANTPGGRSGASGWSDSTGTLWLFGGFGFDANFSLGDMNDLWAVGVPTPAPAIYPPTGTYPSARTVTLGDTIHSATIHYTTDGTTPSLSSPLYTGPFKVNSDATVKAIAEASGHIDSSLATASYIIQKPVTLVWTNPLPVIYGTSLGYSQLNATAVVAGTSDPIAGSFLYSPKAGVALTAGTHTLSATFMPTDLVHYRSVTKTVSIVVRKATLTVTARDSTKVYGALLPSLSYKIAGFVLGQNPSNSLTGIAAVTTTATQSSPLGNYPIKPTLGTLLAANYSFAFVNGTLKVVPIGVVALPVFTPKAGTYKGAQAITFKDATTGAVIYYTLGGATPTAASTKYTKPIPLSKTNTVKAFAAAPGYTQSAVASAAYTIQ